MKGKIFSFKFVILAIILFACLFIFSTTSFALILGDFGSAGGGPPDGCVNFEDLMIFAMAYGSTPPDANWNILCDTYSDNVIDFEDLMIFAMHYGETYAITEVKAIAITTPYSFEPVPPVPASSIIGLVDKINKNGKRDSILRNIKSDQLKGKEGETDYAVAIYWDAILKDGVLNEDVEYKVYRSIDGINYDNIVSDDYFYLDELYFEGEEYIIGGIDTDVGPDSGITYSYYVTTFGSGWESNPSQVVSIDTWLPSCCSLNSPQDGSLITEPNPIFTWNPIDVSTFPYGSICSGESDLWVCDTTEFAQAWWIIFHDLTTSTAIYNQDGQATSLVPGHGYYWDSWGYGYNLNGDLIAMSICEARSFNYKITEGVVFNVSAVAVTSKLGYEDYYVEISYNSYPEATDYEIYRSVNGGDYELLPDYLYREFPPDNNWHNLEGWFVSSPTPFWDDDVSPENTYSYYVIACGDGWETAPSEIVTVDTWLPFCVLTSPPNNSAITDPNPTFTWNPGVLGLPYGSICSGKSHLFVDSQTYPFICWSIYFDNIITSSATYNQDSQATPLEVGNRYGWQIDLHGYDENGKLIAVSESINWNFQYGAMVTDIEARAYTSQGTSMEMFQAKMEQLVEEELIPDSYQLNELPPLSKEVTEYRIVVYWHSYPDSTGYKVYRSIDGGSYSVVFQDEPTTGNDWYSFWDNDVSEGSSYTYYVTAYGSGWETDPSPEVTIDTFLPPCSLISPTDESIITESNPTFTWNPVGVSSFPYGSIYSGTSNLNVWGGEGGWYPYFDDLTTSSATYNQDSQATPLEVGNTYGWRIDSRGCDGNGKLIACSWSEYWDFQYGAIVTDIEARAITRQGTSMEMFQAKMEQLVEEELIPDSYHLNELSPLARGVTEYEIEVDWHSYPDATGYKVYRSIDGGSYSVVFQDEPTTGYDWYSFWDDDVSESSSYTYYVTAYGSGWETDPSPEVTIDTFLPPCSLISPTDESIITESNPTFTWNPVGVSSFPYGSIYSGTSNLIVWGNVGGWYPYFDDLTTASATYNQDGQAIPLEVGNSYTWYINSYGYGENGKLIAYSWSEVWDFTYTDN